MTKDFKGEVYLSSDGKNTVHFEADTPEGRTAGGEWAIKVYRALEKEFGTKADMWERTINKGNRSMEKKPSIVKEDQDSCPHTTFKVLQVKKEGSNKGKWFKTCENCKKFLSWMETEGENDN